jgi:hypothetical protein
MNGATTPFESASSNRDSAPLGKRIRGFQHFGMTVQNMDRAFEFYTEILGGTEVLRDGDFHAEKIRRAAPALSLLPALAPLAHRRASILIPSGSMYIRVGGSIFPSMRNTPANPAGVYVYVMSKCTHLPSRTGILVISSSAQPQISSSRNSTHVHPGRRVPFVDCKAGARGR